MHIPDYLINEVIDRTDIVNTISKYVTLTKTGGNHKAKCPFHDEKTASLIVSPRKNIYKCFGCGKGGNVITFVQNYEKISFHEAVKLLAEQAGIKFNIYPEDERNIQIRKGLKEVYSKVLEFYHKQLINPNSEPADIALSYALSRMSEEDIKRMKIGFSPSNQEGNLLFKYLKKDFNQKLLQNSGLFTAKYHIYDFFRSRLMIPIFDQFGDCATFSSRAIPLESGKVLGDYKEHPKYMNSPETRLFNKRRTLYGLNWAKEEIGKKDFVIIVEGFNDHSQVYNEEYKNVVGTIGTAFTDEHLEILKRHTNNFHLCMDSDEAGFKATKRITKMAWDQGINVKVINLREENQLLSQKGLDPDDFIKKYSREFTLKVDNAEHGFDFLFRTEFNDELMRGLDFENIYNEIINNNTEHSIFNLILHQRSLVLQDLYLSKVAEKLNIDNKSIKQDYETYLDQHSKRVHVNPLFSLEDQVISFVAKSPIHRPRSKNLLTSQDFSEPYLGLFYDFLTSLPNNQTITKAKKTDQMNLFEEKQNPVKEMVNEFKEYADRIKFLISSTELDKLTIILNEVEPPSAKVINAMYYEKNVQRLKNIETGIIETNKEMRTQDGINFHENQRNLNTLLGEYLELWEEHKALQKELGIKQKENK